MISIRQFQLKDLPQMQQINLQCLQENYQLKYWLQHFQTNPEISFVATLDDKVIAYVMGKIEADEKQEQQDQVSGHGHIVSVACLQEYRHLGLTKRLMQQVLCQMRDVYKVDHCELHCRSINDAAQHLYQKSCGFLESQLDPGYFADGEDAYRMICRFENLDEHGNVKKDLDMVEIDVNNKKEQQETKK